MADRVPAWEHYPHEADMGIRGWGSSVTEAFEQAALALTAIITQLEKVEPLSEVEIICEAPDLELLLVEFLNAMIYQMAVRHMLFTHITVTIENSQLHAILLGEKVDRQKHQPAVEVKGATFTDLLVKQLPEKVWIAQCVVDV